MEAERRSDREGDDGGWMAAGSSSGAMVRRETRRSEVGLEKSSSLPPPLPKEAVKIDKKKTKKRSDYSIEDILKILDMSEEELAVVKEEWAEMEAKEKEEAPKVKETMVEWEARVKKRIEEENKAYREMMRSQDEDESSWDAIQYRKSWNARWSGTRGSFEDTTRIPPMRFTHKPALDYSAAATPTLQVFFVKVAVAKGALQWPLDVFGIVAMRDVLDRNRNIVFHRTRDNCQTLTEEDRNLVLVGPTHAVALSMPEPVIIDVELRVKGTTESEDKGLSFLAVPLLCDDTSYSRLLHSGSYTSKLSTLEFRLGYITSSVEATIFIRVIQGSWPDGLSAQFAAFTTGFYGKGMACRDSNTSIDDERIVLLDSRGEKVVVTSDGNIKLSRRVVSVESNAELKVSVKAWKAYNNVVKNVNVFTALEAGVSYATLDIVFCKLEISVAWSLISQYPVSANSVL
uniref:DUF6598 domain-containing protein n=1 Tax=Oryza glumipatula TaxID=40148 RepID=A0A0E0AQP2_9ORYZ